MTHRTDLWPVGLKMQLLSFRNDNFGEPVETGITMSECLEVDGHVMRRLFENGCNASSEWMMQMVLTLTRNVAVPWPVHCMYPIGDDPDGDQSEVIRELQKSEQGEVA